MKKKYDLLVFIGRFQPFHNGHEKVVRKALEISENVLVLVGSSFQARSIRNPFTFYERRDMIESVFPEENLFISAIIDYPYDDSVWLSKVKGVIWGTAESIKATGKCEKIGIIGHEKDGSSYYLKMFPGFGSESVPNFEGINSTEIREDILGEYRDFDKILPFVPDQVFDYLDHIIYGGAILPSEEFEDLFEDFKMIQKYKESWDPAPYPPTFVTTDAVVTVSGHVLLVKRKASPGKGLWALPGGFLNQSETLLNGAIRELREETKLKVPVPVLKGSIVGEKTFDNPYRSSRGRTITTAFHFDLGFEETLPKVKGSDDAEKACWVPINEIDPTKMFEDHYGIIQYFTKVN